MPKSSSLDDLAKMVASELQGDASKLAAQIGPEIVPQSRVVNQDQFLDHHADNWMQPGHQEQVRDQHGQTGFDNIQADLVKTGRIPAGLPPSGVLQGAMQPPGPIQVPSSMAAPSIPMPLMPPPQPPMIPMPAPPMGGQSPMVPPPQLQPPPMAQPSPIPNQLPQPPPEGMILPPAVLAAIAKAQQEAQGGSNGPTK